MYHLKLRLAVFQSAPDLINRENNCIVTMQWLQAKFQSAPDLINRENQEHLELLFNTDQVSIRSRFN